MKKSLAELAYEHALVFISDSTEYPIDGLVHRSLVLAMLNFHEEASELESHSQQVSNGHN